MTGIGSRAVTYVLMLFVVLGGAVARAEKPEKPEKIPVAMGTWTGPKASRFKSAVRSGIVAVKECAVVRPNKARVIIDGEVKSEDDKHFAVHVTLKSPKTNDIVESRDYTFNKPEPSQNQSKKMGRDVTEIARRSPE
jgi:hypothetical protein